MTELEYQILALFENNTKPMSREEIIRSLSDTAEASELSAALLEMERSCLLMSGNREKLAPPARFGYAAGTYWASGRGFGFLMPDDGTGDYFIPPRKDGGAWHKDRVLAKLESRQAENGRPEAAVTKIIRRGIDSLQGKLFRGKKSAYMLPDNSRYPKITIPVSKLHGARNGDKVSAAITSYGGRKGISGSVERIFGKDGSRETQTAAILHNLEVSTEFSPAAMEQAKSISQEANDLDGRLDLRDRLIFTIDGEDAKDLDDAVSLEQKVDGTVTLGVHIADVSHYVRSGDPLDQDAFLRGTSIYYADQVIPMLPVELSNGICSLNPQVDRLCMTVFMTFEPDGKQIKKSIHKSVIRSKYRMTYQACNALLAESDSELADQYAELLPCLREMARLADVLADKRRSRGSLDLFTLESHIICDESGSPVDILPRERGDSQEIIEQFMISANETVAKYMLEKPMVYRVHEEPSAVKMEAFSEVARTFGYQLPKEVDAYALQKILKQAESKPEQPLINAMLLRSMMKARYSPVNAGHYGLALSHYCHFTSPIRRYPDLAVHRLLKQFLAGQLENQEREEEARYFAAGAAEQSSRRERAAQEAEREIEKLYMAEYMQQYVGASFDGTVSGVQRFGLFVTLSNTVEGFVPIETMTEGDYIFDEQSMSLISRSLGKAYKFGALVSVLVAAADPGTGQITFQIIEDSRP